MTKNIDVGIGRDEEGSCLISFSEKGFGFGEFRFYYNANGKLMLDNEAMSKKRIKKYLCTLVDKAELVDK